MEDVEENSKKHKDIHTHTYIDSHPTKSPKNPTQNGSFVSNDTSNHLEKTRISRITRRFSSKQAISGKYQTHHDFQKNTQNEDARFGSQVCKENVESCEVSFVLSFNFNILIIQLLTGYASYKKITMILQNVWFLKRILWISKPYFLG